MISRLIVLEASLEKVFKHVWKLKFLKMLPDQRDSVMSDEEWKYKSHNLHDFAPDCKIGAVVA